MKKLIASFITLIFTPLMMAYTVEENCEWPKTWKVKSYLSRGKFGIVYDVGHAEGEGAFAMKQQKLGKVFESEVRVYVDLQRKNFEHVPPLYGLWKCRDEGFIVMQKLKPCLSKRVSKEKIYQFIADVKVVVKELNSKGWLHLDLHQGNVLCDPTTNKIKIIDFGLVHNMRASKPLTFHFALQRSKIDGIERYLVSRFYADQSPSSTSDNASKVESPEDPQNKRSRKKKSGGS